MYHEKTSAWGREPVVGVVYDPYADELFMAAKGEGVPAAGLVEEYNMVGLGGVVKVSKKQMFASFYVVCFVIKSY